MLEGLDSIDWASLQHAYGTASDVPDLLRSLLAEDKQIRDNAIWELFGNIHHQGTIYEASSYTIPFLMEILESPDCLDKDSIACLVVCIVGYYEVYATGVMKKDVVEILAKQNKSLNEVSWEESEIIHRVRSVALPYIPRLLPYLQNVELVDQCGYEFALMLSRYPEYFETTIPVLENAVSVQTDDDIKEKMQALLDDMKKL